MGHPQRPSPRAFLCAAGTPAGSPAGTPGWLSASPEWASAEPASSPRTGPATSRKSTSCHADSADSEQEIRVGQRRRRHCTRVRRTLHAPADQRRVGVVARQLRVRVLVVRFGEVVVLDEVLVVPGVVGIQARGFAAEVSRHHAHRRPQRVRERADQAVVRTDERHE